MTQLVSGLVLPFVLDNIPVRGRLFRLGDIAQHVPSLHGQDNVVSRSIIELLATGAVMASELKNPDVDRDASVTLQIVSPGPVPLLLAQCSHRGNMRAYAQVEGDADTVTFADIAQKIDEMAAHFAVTVDYGTGFTPYQSLVALNQESVASSVSDYFNESVQIPTYFRTFAAEIDDELQCGALFLQTIPEKGDFPEDDWQRMGLILDTIKPEEILPGDIASEHLLQRLFAEDTVRIFEAQALKFAAPDTKERMTKALLSLGKEACLEMLKDGPIVMTCEYTGKQEVFKEDDIDALFQAN